MKEIKANSRLNIDGTLVGDTKQGETLVKDISSFLMDSNISDSEASKVAYGVRVSKNAVSEGQQGGLFFGVSTLNAGSINNEYYFTRGHYHEKLDTGEYYWGISGEGLLLLHYPDDTETITRVSPGSVLYIPGKVAHRLINIGKSKLAVGAVWQSISGHAYSQTNLFRMHILVDDIKDYRVIEEEK
ncbi:glucose-6-phosphate isomerase family protein [Companilactobacillus kimchiensis]|nr:glucose-6-phosphate isomerase family protein [Companilactobacillus kimchiensis]